MHLRSLCFSVSLSAVSVAPPAFACEVGTTCLDVKDNGSPSPGSGTFTAQCAGRFPDFIFTTAALPSGYAGPWFRLSQAYPATAPAGDAPWAAIDFRKGPAEADQYLFALRYYAFEGMTGTDFRPENNTQRAWYHMPLMNFGANRREPAHGVTGERPVKGPELGLKIGATIHDYAVGFYNAAAAATLGKVWASGTPDLTKRISRTARWRSRSCFRTPRQRITRTRAVSAAGRASPDDPDRQRAGRRPFDADGRRRHREGRTERLGVRDLRF